MWVRPCLFRRVRVLCVLAVRGTVQSSCRCLSSSRAAWGEGMSPSVLSTEKISGVPRSVWGTLLAPRHAADRMDGERSTLPTEGRTDSLAGAKKKRMFSPRMSLSWRKSPRPEVHEIHVVEVYKVRVRAKTTCVARLSLTGHARFCMRRWRAHHGLASTSGTSMGT